MWQLMQTARTLEAEWKQVLRGRVGTGTKADESRAGRIWAAGFHHVTARSRFARFLKFMYCLFVRVSFFFQAAVNRG
jgi:hypothetical protein